MAKFKDKFEVEVTKDEITVTLIEQDPDQFLVDCYVASDFIITERKEPTTIEGFSYKFTACTDNGIPVMDVYQDDNGDIKEVKMDRPTPCKGCSEYDTCDFENCERYLDWVATEVMTLMGFT